MDRRALGRAGAAARGAAALVSFVVHRPDLLAAPLVSEQVRGSGTPGFVDALDALTDYPIRDRLERIGCPTLIVWGENDHPVPVGDADEFARLIPGAPRRVAGDGARAEARAPPEAFTGLVDAFVAEGPGERVDRAGARGPRRGAGRALVSEA